MAVIEQRKGRNGQAIYRVKIRLKGLPEESQSFERKTDAKEWAQTREAELKKERAFGFTAVARKTLGELIDRYVRDELPKRQNDVAKIKAQLAWWKTELGDVELRNLTAARLSGARDKLLRSPNERNRAKEKSSETSCKSPATVIRYMASLSHALTIAEKEWEWLLTNPMRKVKRPSLPQARVRFLSEEERPRLLDACQDSACDYLYPIVIIALSTGARYSEILHLRWQDIDLDRGVARLEKTKNQERRALPLTHLALEQVKLLRSALEEAPEPKAFVFARADGKAPMEIRKHWYAAVEKAGIEDFRFHDLRHSAASYLAMNGATLAEIAEVLGHKTLQMVKRYAHLSDQHTAKVVERMNRSIFPANDNDQEEEASADEASG